MIDTPQIAQSTARQVAMIRLTVPTSQIRTALAGPLAIVASAPPSLPGVTIGFRCAR